MKIFQFLFTALILNIPYLSAQKAKVLEVDSTGFSFKKIMVIPFEENMYISSIQSDLLQSSGKTHKEIVQFFRYGIASAIQNEFLNTVNTTSLIHYNDTTHDLDRTYYGVNYKFEPFIEQIKSDDLTKKTSAKSLKNEEISIKNETKTEIKNGQVISSKKQEIKFASLQIKDSTILPFLSQKYGADVFVFITELDLENDLSDPLALANETYIRNIRAHYAIVDVKGKFISKGIVSSIFPNTVNEIEKIQAVYFKELAIQLMDKLPKTPLPIYTKPVESKKSRKQNANK